jgi:hypothetical protein
VKSVGRRATKDSWLCADLLLLLLLLVASGRWCRGSCSCSCCCRRPRLLVASCQLLVAGCLFALAQLSLAVAGAGSSDGDGCCRGRVAIAVVLCARVS